MTVGSASDLIKMKTQVIITTFLLITTKLADVVSTLRIIRKSRQETNPIGQRMMYYWGVQKSAWAVFGIALIIIIAAGTAALFGPLAYQVAFVVLGIFISIVQAGVALCNWTGRENRVSRFVLKFYSGSGHAECLDKGLVFKNPLFLERNRPVLGSKRVV